MFTYRIIIAASCTQRSFGICVKSFSHRSTPVAERLEGTCGCGCHGILFYNVYDLDVVYDTTRPKRLVICKYYMFTVVYGSGFVSIR